MALKAGRAEDLCLDLALRIDGDRSRILRNGDTGRHHIAFVGDDLPVRRKSKRAGARVGVGAIGHLDVEIALAVDRQIVGIAGGGKICPGP